MTNPSLIFFGSGPVAARSLQLLRESFNIEAVVTKPSTATLLQQACPNAQLYTVEKRQDLNKLIQGNRFSSPCGVIIDFGIIVSRQVIEAFPRGILNSHFSLLPEWRGADPITFAILSGQPMTGVSVMLLSEGMDEGPLLAQAPYIIPGEVTNQQLTDALIEISDAMLKDIIPQYIAGNVIPAPQETATLLNDPTPSYSRKITKEDGILNWDKPAATLEREIRAFSVWPKSHTLLAGKEVIITKANVSDKHLDKARVCVEGKHLFIGCGDGLSLEILRLKPAGKSEMATSAFLAGYRQLIV